MYLNQFLKHNNNQVFYKNIKLLLYFSLMFLQSIICHAQIKFSGLNPAFSFTESSIDNSEENSLNDSGFDMDLSNDDEANPDEIISDDYISRGVSNNGFLIMQVKSLPIIYSIKDDNTIDLTGTVFPKLEMLTLEALAKTNPRSFQLLKQFNYSNEIIEGSLCISENGENVMWLTKDGKVYRWSKKEGLCREPISDRPSKFIMSPNEKNLMYVYETSSFDPFINKNLKNISIYNNGTLKTFTGEVKTNDISADGNILVGSYKKNPTKISPFLMNNSLTNPNININIKTDSLIQQILKPLADYCQKNRCTLINNYDELFKISQNCDTFLGLTKIHTWYPTKQNGCIPFQEIDKFELEEELKDNIKKIQETTPVNEEKKIVIYILYLFNQVTGQFTVLDHSVKHPILNSIIKELFMSQDQKLIAGTCDNNAVIWTQETGTILLQDFLINIKAEGDFDQWQQLEAITGMSPNGNYICGYGINSIGNKEGFYVDFSASHFKDQH